MIRAHMDVLLAQLRLDDVLEDATFADEVTGSPQRYCVVNLNSGDRYGDRLAAPDVSAMFRAGIRSIGTTREQAQAVAERVFAQVMNVRLTVPGRQLSMIKHDGGQPTQFDDTARLWFASDFFTFTSDPV